MFTKIKNNVCSKLLSYDKCGIPTCGATSPTQHKVRGFAGRGRGMAMGLIDREEGAAIKVPAYVILSLNIDRLVFSTLPHVQMGIIQNLTFQ